VGAGYGGARRAVMAARLMLIEGEIQRSKEDVVHLMVGRVIDRSDMLGRLASDGMPNRPSQHRHPRNVRILPKSRDFH
jgi:error-prone DNA polymerase